jgi:hypothetical protein
VIVCNHGLTTIPSGGTEFHRGNEKIGLGRQEGDARRVDRKVRRPGFDGSDGDAAEAIRQPIRQPLFPTPAAAYDDAMAAGARPEHRRQQIPSRLFDRFARLDDHRPERRRGACYRANPIQRHPYRRPAHVGTWDAEPGAL